MTGLYEAAIEALCVREIDGRVLRPKIVASTATVRRAQDQIQALFARPLTQVFPPPGPDRRDSFFAQTVSSSKVPARLYLGAAAQGRNPKVVLRKLERMGISGQSLPHGSEPPTKSPLARQDRISSGRDLRRQASTPATPGACTRNFLAPRSNPFEQARTHFSTDPKPSKFSHAEWNRRRTCESRYF